MSCKKHRTPPPRGEVCPRVMHLSRLLRQNFNKTAAEEGLFSSQQDIVLKVVENEGITLGALARELGVSSATASVSIKRMEKAGFIIKKPDTRDARIVRLFPTEKAKAAPENIRNRMNELEGVFLADISGDKINELSDLLDKIIHNIEERGDCE